MNLEDHDSIRSRLEEAQLSAYLYDYETHVLRIETDPRNDPELRARLDGWRNEISQWPEHLAKDNARYALDNVKAPRAYEEYSIYLARHRKDGTLLAAGSCHSGSGNTHLDFIGVRPDYQRQGIGTVLESRVLVDAAAKGNQITAVSDEQAGDFHRRLGFTVSKQVGAGGPQIEMSAEDAQRFAALHGDVERAYAGLRNGVDQERLDGEIAVVESRDLSDPQRKRIIDMLQSQRVRALDAMLAAHWNDDDHAYEVAKATYDLATTNEETLKEKWGGPSQTRSPRQ